MGKGRIMSFTLHDAVAPNWLQTLGAVARLLDKAQAHCIEHKMPESTLIEARLAPDMLPLGFQVKSTVAHSIGAIEGVRRGSFSPDRSAWPHTLAGLKELVTQAWQAVEQVDPAEINGFIGRDMCFEAGDTRIEFTAQDFLLSFSVPNFYFHAATAYDILRNQGLPLAKRDFLGKMRRKA
jgi:uncharacterized protein